MAISPIVNSFMRQNEPQGPTDAAQIFQNQFSDMAFNALRAKFPALINNVVTLKHLASDVEKGSAFGVFVISSGNDLVYIPVVMADGSIVSCEMIYDKEADQFYPLDCNTAKEILAKSKSSDPVILRGNPRVEDTRRLFHNMVRPPTSSNVVLASEKAGISALPDALKEKVCAYLEKENPRLLGKIASFYDLQELALKLAPAPKLEKSAGEPEVSFIRKDSLGKEAAAKLSRDEKKTIRKRGYIIKKAANKNDNKPLIVASKDDLRKAVESELRLTLYSPPDHGYSFQHIAGNPYFCKLAKGKLVHFDSNGLVFTPVYICEDMLFTPDGRRDIISPRESVLIQDFTFDNIAPASSPVFVPLSGLRGKLANLHEHVQIKLFVPGKSESWLCVFTDLFGRAGDFNITDNRVSVGNRSIQTSPKIAKGYISATDYTLIVPENSFFFPCKGISGSLPRLSSFEKLLELMQVFGETLITSDNGAGRDITSSEKTASFATPIDAAEWLHKKFGMDYGQIETVLRNPRTFVLNKTAFLDPTPEMLGQQDEYSMQSPEMTEQPEYGEMPAIQPQNPDFDALEDFAAMEDPEMLDTGILASFAQYPDIKALLVEYMPDFLAAEDKIGRVLLLFCSQKKEIEQFYGTEKCSTLIASLRRIFSILGELVASLKLRINMV